MKWRISEAFNLSGSRNLRLALALLFISLATIVVMTLFSVAKVVLDPDVTVWQTHTYTILFTGIMAPLIALLVLLKFEGLYQRASRENEERNRAEETLAGNLAVLAKSQEIARLGSWSLDSETGRYEVSDEIHRIYGFEPGAVEPVQDRVLERIHPDDLERFREYFESVRRDGHQGGIDYRVVWPDGSVHYLHALTDSVVRGEDGRVKTATGITQDVTERKLAEYALRESEANLARAQRITRLGNWSWDVKGDRVQGSAEFLRLFGFTDKQSIAYGEFIARLHPDDRGPVDGAVKAALSGSRSYSIDYRVMLDGVERVIHAEGEVTRDDAGQPVTMFGTVQDITERKRAEKELADAKVQAELYVDLMGHDINNLNQSAQGYLELALQALDADGRIGMDGRLMIEKPLQAVQSSSRLIENVRKLQRLTDEGVKTRPVDLHDLFGGLEALDFHVGDRDATIHIREVPSAFVEGSDLLRDVFFNLISNAIKHSRPDWPVVIDVKAEPIEADGRAYYRCTVEDNGPGVPDDLKPRLFHRFQRGKTRAHGKGLGLYLVRTLVEGYGGKVWVEDRVQGDHTQGARFVVLLLAVEK